MVLGRKNYEYDVLRMYVLGRVNFMDRIGFAGVSQTLQLKPVNTISTFQNGKMVIHGYTSRYTSVLWQLGLEALESRERAFLVCSPRRKGSNTRGAAGAEGAARAGKQQQQQQAVEHQMEHQHQQQHG